MKYNKSSPSESSQPGSFSVVLTLSHRSLMGEKELICLGDLKFASKAESLEGILKVMVGRIMPAKGN